MKVDTVWTNLMTQTKLIQNVLEACNQHQVSENLKMCNDNIEFVKKQLNAYLHEK